MRLCRGSGPRGRGRQGRPTYRRVSTTALSGNNARSVRFTAACPRIGQGCLFQGRIGAPFGSRTAAVPSPRGGRPCPGPPGTSTRTARPGREPSRIGHTHGECGLGRNLYCQCDPMPPQGGMRSEFGGRTLPAAIWCPDVRLPASRPENRVSAMRVIFPARIEARSGQGFTFALPRFHHTSREVEAQTQFRVPGSPFRWDKAPSMVCAGAVTHSRAPWLVSRNAVWADGPALTGPVRINLI